MDKSGYRYAANLNVESDFPYFVRRAENNVFSAGDVDFGVFHWHEDLQFIYCISGKVCVKTMEEEVFLSDGEGVFTNKGVIHYSIGMSMPCSYRLFRFPERLVSFYVGSPAEKLTQMVTGNPELPIVRIDSSEKWGSQILKLLQKLTVLDEKQEADPLYSYNVMVTLVQIWQLMLQNTEVPVQKKENVTGQRMRRFLEFIEKHYAEDISLEELAASADVSKSEALRCFRQTLDTTPYRYLMDHRLSKAAELLAEDNLSVSEIAERTGFHQQSYFGKCFKEKTGMSPGQYRKTI